MMLTPAQCRAARGFLNWTLADLAGASGISRASLNAFEGGKGNMKSDTLAAIAAALEKNGIELTAEPGVRLKSQRLEVTKLEGENAFEQLMDIIYQTMLKDKTEVLLTGYELELYRQATGYFPLLRRQIERYQKHGITERMILREGDRSFAFPKDVTTYHWLSNEFFSPVPMAIFGDKQAITIFEPHFTVVITENAQVAAAYRKQFELLWSLSKAPPYTEDEMDALRSASYPA